MADDAAAAIPAKPTNPLHARSLPTQFNSYDWDTTEMGALQQPAAWVTIFNIFMAVFTQVSPRTFLAKHLVGKKILDTAAERTLIVPFASAAMMFSHTAMVVQVPEFRLHGHLFGLANALVYAAVCFSPRICRIGFAYPFLGSGHLAFGLFHHYRNASIITGGAPLITFSEIPEIVQIRRQRKAIREERAKAERAAAFSKQWRW